MTVPVLVVTSAYNTGELVRRALEDSGRYQVALAHSAVQGIRHARSTPFVLAILDTRLEGEDSGVSLSKLSITLRALLPEIQLVVVAPDGDLYDPASNPLAPDAILTLPLNSNQILHTVEGLPIRLNDTTQSVVDDGASRVEPVVGAAVGGEAKKEMPAWLQDVSRAAQHLTRLSLESAAQAALIVYQDSLWAYAGELLQPSAQELADIVATTWDDSNDSDLARFVHLDSTDGEYMLYATALGANMVLALVYGVETPFSKIRSQAACLARSLASPPGIDHEPSLPGSGREQDGEGAGRKPAPEQLEALEYISLLEDVPPPRSGSVGQEPRSSSMDNVPEEDDFSEFPNLTSGGQFYAAVNDDLNDAYADPQSSHQTVTHDPLADTSPVRISSAPRHDSQVFMMEDWDLKPASAGVCSLNYGLLLLPRLPEHHLVGDLADRLPLWISQLSVAFAWRLEHISVRPEYLLWNASASPDLAPGRIVRDIRRHTSSRIFDQFPLLGRENPSGDFWAPGFLLISGSKPPPVELVRDFIRQTRRNQGLLRPGKR